MARAAYIAAVVLLCAGCAAPSDAVRAADTHARTASAILTGPPELPARWAVFRVIGSGVDDKIDVLEARGTNYNGRIVLRISTTADANRLTPTHAVRCYLYRITNATRGDPPASVNCNKRPLALPTPPPPIVLSMKDETRLGAILSAIPPDERHDYAAITRVVSRTYGTPLLVVADRGTKGDTYVQVTTRLMTPVECLIASLPASGPATVKYGDRFFCTGG